jgi:hypothetical protein
LPVILFSSFGRPKYDKTANNAIAAAIKSRILKLLPLWLPNIDRLSPGVRRYMPPERPG